MQLNRLPALISELESQREGRVIVLCSSHLDMHIIPELYEVLRDLGPLDSLRVVIQCRGGEVNAARRIALLFRDFAAHVEFLVPFWCESAATLLVLSGNRLEYLPTAIFTPIDPHLQGAGAEGEATSISALDIKDFRQMASEWFSEGGGMSGAEALSTLCNSLFPPTLTGFYRSTKEVEAIARELLSLGHRDINQHGDIMAQLLFGYGSHDYALTGSELARLGLPAAPLEQAAGLVWEMSRILQRQVGGHLRASPDAGWQDALIASVAGIRVRHRSDRALSGHWDCHGELQG